MGFLDRLFKSTAKPRSTMLSASVSLRGGRYYLVTIHGSDGSDPCLAAGPVDALVANATPTMLGAAIRRALQRTTHDRAYPANASDWKAITAPLLTAAGCKSWAAFAKGASDLRVDQIGTRLQVLPSLRDEKGAFASLADRQRQLEAPSDAELGAVVAAELAFALQRDG